MSAAALWRGSLALALTSMLMACGEGGESRITELPEPQSALTEELMIALGQAKNYHHKADVYLSDGKPELAERALSRLLEVPFPEDSPEAEDVLLDARARLAALRLGQGAIDDALAIAERGIAAAERDSFFLANLYTVRGEIYEARAEALDAAEPADPEAAERARRRALESYSRSIAINERLQERLMREAAR